MSPINLAFDLDAAMRYRITGEGEDPTVDGYVTQFRASVLGELVSALEKSAEPPALCIGLFLLTLGEEAVRDLGDNVIRTIKATRKDGGSHDMTVWFEGPSTGLTLHCNNAIEGEATKRLKMHSMLRKHRHKAGRWFGIGLDPNSGAIRHVLKLEYEWEPDEDLDRLERSSLKDDTTGAKGSVRQRKIGRNEPCPCGSGKKYKRCCLRK